MGDNGKMTRFEFLMTMVDGYVVQKIETKDYLEVVIKSHGKQKTYRVYGNHIDGFRFSVK